MKQKTDTILSFAGVHFAPDNHVLPVLRWRQFHRMAGPGYVRINPFIEETLAPVNVGLQVGKFSFENMLSRDNVAFTINTTVLYRFEFERAVRNVISQMVRLTARQRSDIVQDYVSHELHRLTSLHNATQLSGSRVIKSIEAALTEVLREKLEMLGLMLLPKDGVLIRETIPSTDFEQVILTARQHEALLSSLTAYPNEETAELAVKAQLYNRVQDGSNLTVLSSDGQHNGQPPVSVPLVSPSNPPTRGKTGPLKSNKLGRFPSSPATS